MIRRVGLGRRDLRVTAAWPLAGVLALLVGANWGCMQFGRVVECEHAKLNTEDATPVDPGGIEIEVAGSLTTSRRSFTAGRGRERRPYSRQEAADLGITYGVAEDLDVGIGLGYASCYDRGADDLTGHGWGDLELGAKWRFYRDETRRLEVAYVPAIALPTGEDEMADGFFRISNGIAASKDWTDRLTSNADMGFSVAVGGRRDDYQGTLAANAALGYHVTPWLQPEAELNYSHDFCHGGDADLLAATFGVIVCGHKNYRLDVGIQQGLTGRRSDQETIFLVVLTTAY